jgi:3-oxoacyl-[acyl-carrier-protein] synthase II
MGWCTPLGDDLEQVWDRLCAAETGVAEVPSPHRLRGGVAAVVRTPEYGSDSPAERMLAIARRALAAALADAGLTHDDARVRLVVGTSFGGELDEPVPSAVAWPDALADLVGLRHAPVLVTTACSAGSDSIQAADAMIRTGRADICVVGGVDVLSEAKRLGHSALGTMSPTGLRAFAESRDGTVLGEGAGFLVLESARSARMRAVRVHAVLSGVGSANDATGLTAPDPTGRSVVAAVRRCVERSNTTLAEVGVVCAHGTGTRLNDEVEAASLRQVFADHAPGPVVFATKGALGHSLGATGAIEAVATVLALRKRKVPPIAGMVAGGAAAPRFAAGAPMPVDGNAGLSLTLGFGGFNTCLLFAGPDERAS